MSLLSEKPKKTLSEKERFERALFTEDGLEIVKDVANEHNNLKILFLIKIYQMLENLEKRIADLEKQIQDQQEE